MEKLTSRRDPLSLHVKKLGSDRSYRTQHERFLCEGRKLLEEAIRYGADINIIITVSELPFPVPEGVKIYIASQSLIDSLSSLKNAQDVLFTCSIKNNDAAARDFDKGLHILLDGVQDPGNVGTVIRSAFAFGISSVILTGDCADPYNPKTIRATMGAVFAQNICRMDLAGLNRLKLGGIVFSGASQHKNSVDIRSIELKDKIIAIGSEGAGLSGGVAALCNDMIKIPISKDCESLNAAVAASLIMWEYARKG